MKDQEKIKLNRNVTAIQIPFGTPHELVQNSEVIINYSLGGTHTVSFQGNMYRIESKDADALGKINPIFTLADNENSSLENKIWAILRTCYDPEIPVNIVDLGLIYGINITAADNSKSDVMIHMTLTSPGCGMGPIIAADAKQKVLSLPEVNSVEIDTVFDPPWDRSMLSEQAKLELGLL